MVPMIYLYTSIHPVVQCFERFKSGDRNTESVSFSPKRLSRSGCFRDTLAKYEVTALFNTGAFSSVLWERHGLSSAYLSTWLAIDSATMTGLLLRMEALGPSHSASRSERRQDDPGGPYSSRSRS